jgi:hypothetical protein
MNWGLVLYGLIRLLLWSAAVGIALFPTLQAVPQAPTWHLSATMAMVNSSGHFRDLFFVVVPAAAVALATTFDFLSANLNRVPEVTGLSAIIALLLNVVVLLSGFVGFLLIPSGRVVLGPDAFWLYSWLISLGLAISLITELWVSGANEVQRRALRNLVRG